jgi:MFS transporter, SP family, inositol transporter
MRRGLAESARWTNAAKSVAGGGRKLAELFKGANLRAVVWTATIYLFWNLAAGTAGLFNPYIISTLDAGSQAMSVGLASGNFVITMIVTVTIFMRYSDRSYKTRKLIWGVGAVMQVIAYGLFLFMPFTILSVILNIVLFSVSSALSGEAFYKVFSQELFPTMLRGTAQGFTFGVARTILGIWSFFVPMLAHAGIKQIAGLLTLFLFISGVVGYFFMPDTSGKSLEQIQAERN